MRRLREQKKWVFLALFAMLILTGSTFTQSRAILPFQAANRGASPSWIERQSEEEVLEAVVEEEGDEKIAGWNQTDKPVPPGQAKKEAVPSEEVLDEPEGSLEEIPATEPEEVEEESISSEKEHPGLPKGQQGKSNEEEEETIVDDGPIVNDEDDNPTVEDEEEAPVVADDEQEHGSQGQGKKEPEGPAPITDPEVDLEQGGQPSEVVEEQPGLSSDSSLFTILIDGKRIPGFSPDKKDYSYTFNADIQVLPPIYAVPYHEEATVKYSTVTQLPDTMVIQVTAEDGSKTHYHLHLTASGLQEGEIILLLEAIPEAVPQDMLGLWLPPTEEEFELGKGSVAIRFWVADPLLTPEIWIYNPAGATSDAVIKISTGELKMNTGSGKHSRSTVTSGEGGFYKYNLKLKSFSTLDVGERYTLAVMDGSEQVYFGENKPAVIHFAVVEAFKEAPSNRNRTDDKAQGRSNAGGKH